MFHNERDQKKTYTSTVLNDNGHTGIKQREAKRIFIGLLKSDRNNFLWYLRIYNCIGVVGINPVFHFDTPGGED